MIKLNYTLKSIDFLKYYIFLILIVNNTIVCVCVYCIVYLFWIFLDTYLVCDDQMVVFMCVCMYVYVCVVLFSCVKRDCIIT